MTSSRHRRRSKTTIASEVAISLPRSPPTELEKADSLNQGENNLLSILVVDPHDRLRQALEDFFQLEGHRVIAARNRIEGLEKLAKEYSINLVFIELTNRKAKGLELIKQIRSDKLLDGIYLIATTALWREKDRTKALELGADDFLVKPFTPADLLARVRVASRIVSFQRRLRTLAEIDDLTGLLNRRALQQRAKQEFDRTQLVHLPFSFLVVDIDDFKKINDKYGHQTGDAVLTQVAKVIANTVDSTSILGRYGGEEFCLVLSGCSLGDATALAERMRVSVELTSFSYPPSDFSLTVSIGISSTLLRNYSRLEELFNDADRALYFAKAGGKNNFKVYS
jgi:two-component system cell cycle response regulator